MGSELIVTFDFPQVLDMCTGKESLYEYLEGEARSLLPDLYPEYNLDFFDVQISDIQLEYDENVIVVFNAERNDIGR